MRAPSTNPAQQHDLVPTAAQRLVKAAGIGAGDRVWEVGPGLGALTAPLLTAGATVHAVERDGERVAALRQRFADAIARGRMVLHHDDALRVQPRFDGPWRAVANPPFTLTGVLVRRWLVGSDAISAPGMIDLVLQREAAEKLCGAEGAQTRSSVLARLCGRPRVGMRLRRDEVTPPSRVDLACWSFTRHDDAPPADELERVDRLLAIAFAGPRTMGEALRGHATGTMLRRQSAEHGWKPDDHPRTVPPAAWRPLAAIMAMCGKIP